MNLKILNYLDLFPCRNVLIIYFSWDRYVIFCVSNVTKSENKHIVKFT